MSYLMKQFFSPIWNALVNHAGQKPVGFHVPGHGYGEIWSNPLLDEGPEQLAAAWYETIMKLDVTELSSTDDLHHPEASIKEAQELAAKTFGAEETFFLVGGSTSGNLALILALCRPGDLILVQRNVHKSIINGLRLAGATAVFMTPSIDPLNGLATVPDIKLVEKALAQHPEAVAVLLSNPNYYGMSVHLQPYAELAHRYGKPLAVDEAHGAHYGLHPALPPSALAAGADIVVQSAHKTLPTLTMGAMLHVQGGLIDRSYLKECLAMIQSSSPSFPILSSIDISRAMLDRWGSALFEQSLAAAAGFRKWLDSNDNSIAEMPVSITYGDIYRDPLRLVIFDRSGKLTGMELQRSLERQNCYVEMADERYVVLVLGIHSSQKDIDKLQAAIQIIAQSLSKQAESIVQIVTEKWSGAYEAISAPVLFARERFNHLDIERIPLQEAAGRRSAEMITPYPPGIPLLYSGEWITEETVSQLSRLTEAGAKFQGSSSKFLEQIAVFCKDHN
jgi:arginine decarboxylase